jgi:hypothetical protein
MSHEEIVNRLSQIASSPTEAIYAITTENVLSALANRMGERALTLTADDLELAIDDVREAIQHNLDHRDYIEMGLDSFEITRTL